MKTINVTLSKDGIAQACKELDEWNKDFQERVKIFTKRLADEGCYIANVTLGTATEGYDPGSVVIEASEVSGNLVYTASYYMSGSEAIFVEFGAGVHYNSPKGSSLHPLGKQMGMTIGEYRPGSLGRFDTWRKPDGEITHGTPTYMPMYSSAQELAQKIHSIAKEVFNG